MELKTAQLEAVLGGKRILKGIDLSVSDGEFVGVIGPNGSGKSTLLKCIYRVLKPSAGTVYLEGKAMEQIPVKESAKRMGVVAQHNAQNFDFSVEEIVLMGRSPYKHLLQGDSTNDHEIALQSLKEVDMADDASRSFTTLSGGEQQRVLLARALAQQTPSLILDEPTNHLDIRFQLQLLETVKQQGKTVIAALHDLNLAAMFCDWLIVLRQGEVYAAGTPEEILTTDLIRDVYGVEAELMKDGRGNLHILYHHSL